MKILIISSGFFPVTNHMGGAIENLIETYLKENDEKFKNDITLYSVKTNRCVNVEQNYLKNTQIRIIDKTKISYKVRQIFKLLENKLTKKYNGNVYINQIVKDLNDKKEFGLYDCIIVENIGKFVPIIRKYTKSKIIFHLHNDYLNVNTENANKIVESCDYIWCVSEFIANRVKEINKNNSNIQRKVKVLYNGIDMQMFKKSITESEKIELKKKYGFRSEDKIILYTGRLMPEKGVKELLLATKELLNDRKDIGLLIVGGTRQINRNNDGYVIELKKIADTMTNKVIFTGNIPYEELYKFYSISDIQVIPSIWNEAFGLTVVEGMAASIPLIVTNSGGIPEIVDKNNTIIINVDSKLVYNLYKSLSYCLYSDTYRDDCIKTYSERLKNFTKEKYSNNFNKLINETIRME